MRKYTKVFQKGLGHCKKHKVHLTLKSDQPQFFKPRPLPFSLKPAVEMDIQRLVHNGVLQKVEHSNWENLQKLQEFVETSVWQLTLSSLLISILCHDQKNSLLLLMVALNSQKWIFLMPTCSWNLMSLGISWWLWHTWACTSIHAFPLGLPQPLPFFSKQWKQLQGLSGIVCYLDDIVTGKFDAEHLQNLERVLAKIQEYGFQVRKEKCSFMQDSVQYLGHVVDKNGINVSPKKIKGIVEMSKPKNQHQLCSFLEIVNHYGKFLCNLSDMCVPLNKLLQKEQPWSWTNSCQDVFDRIKNN